MLTASLGKRKNQIKPPSTITICCHSRVPTPLLHWLYLELGASHSLEYEQVEFTGKFRVGSLWANSILALITMAKGGRHLGQADAPFYPSQTHQTSWFDVLHFDMLDSLERLSLITCDFHRVEQSRLLVLRMQTIGTLCWKEAGIFAGNSYGLCGQIQPFGIVLASSWASSPLLGNEA